MRAKAKEKLSKKKGDYKNSFFNVEAHLNSRSVKKLTSEKAMKKSIANGFTKSQHFEAAANVNNIFLKSTKMTTGSDKNSSPDVISVKRFYSEFKLKNGKPAKAKITVKETKQNGHTIYSVELFKYKKTALSDGVGLCEA